MEELHGEPLEGERGMVIETVTDERERLGAHATEDRYLDWPVKYVRQSTSETCWAACIAMIVNYRDGYHLDDVTVADMAGIGVHGLPPQSSHAVHKQFHLHEVPSGCFTADGWLDVLQEEGPLIACIAGWPHHGIVIVGGDLSTTHGRFRLHVLDPQRGDEWRDILVLEGLFEKAQMRRQLNETQYALPWGEGQLYAG